jgi:DNA-binding NtrC family response regulator
MDATLFGDGADWLIPEAPGGTLFLDEVQCISSSSQTRLLRILDERSAQNPGSEPSFDLWVISTRTIGSGTLLHDLHTRLTKVRIEVPSLRERREDLLLLVEHVLARPCQTWGRPLKRLLPDVPAALVAYDWPGNLRELAFRIDRLVRDHVGTAVDAKDLDLSTAVDAKDLDRLKDLDPRFDGGLS